MNEHDATTLGRRFAAAMGWEPSLTCRGANGYLFNGEWIGDEHLATYPGMEIVLGELRKAGVEVVLKNSLNPYLWTADGFPVGDDTTFGSATNESLPLAVLAAAVDAVEKGKQ